MSKWEAKKTENSNNSEPKTTNSINQNKEYIKQTDENHNQNYQNEKILPPNQLSNLMAGTYVKIITKQNEKIEGFVRGNIPTNPPLCILHKYSKSPQKTKDILIVSINEVMRLKKTDQQTNIKDIKIDPPDDQEIQEKLQKTLEIRRIKMLTLNKNVDSKIQQLFDTLYRSMPSKSMTWSENDITFNDGLILKEPYKQIESLDNSKNERVDYLQPLIDKFWNEIEDKNKKSPYHKKTPKHYRKNKKHKTNHYNQNMDINNNNLTNFNANLFNFPTNLNIMNNNSNTENINTENHDNNENNTIQNLNNFSNLQNYSNLINNQLLMNGMNNNNNPFNNFNNGEQQQQEQQGYNGTRMFAVNNNRGRGNRRGGRGMRGRGQRGRANNRMRGRQRGRNNRGRGNRNTNGEQYRRTGNKNNGNKIEENIDNNQTDNNNQEIKNQENAI